MLGEVLPGAPHLPIQGLIVPLRIELIETEPGHFTVIAGDRFADHLMRDEALGVIAAALFSGGGAAPYLKTYEQWSAWDAKYRSPQPKPAALLTWNNAPSTH